MHSLFNELSQLQPLFSKKDKLRYLFLFVLMFLASVLEAIGVGAIPMFVALLQKPSDLSKAPMVGEIFVYLPDEPSYNIVFFASLALFSFITLKSLFLVLVFFVQSKVVTGQSIRLRDRMFRVYQSAPYDWHLQRSSADMLRSIQHDAGSITVYVLQPCLDLLMSFVMSMFIVITMVINTPGSAILGLAITGLGLFALVRMFQGQLFQYSLLYRTEDRLMIQSIQQGFGALAESRIVGCEDYLNKIFRQSAIRQGKAIRNRAVIQRATPYMMEVIAVLGLLVILLLLFKAEGSLEKVVPEISLLAVATIRLKQMATKIATSCHSLNSGRAYIPDIVNDINEIQSIRQSQIQRSRSSRFMDAFSSLQIENLSYTYRGTDQPSVCDVSFDLRRGESVALVGPTGSGKSTLANLILGLLEPQSGCIKVNGVDIRDNVVDWRTHLGYIPQSIFLVDDTILANIAFGVPVAEIDMAKVWGALKSACLDDFIDQLPDGIYTEVGERGARLSGGQRQRLGIARAIYFDPEVLVMDEATSALDNKTEVEVMEALDNLKKNRTIIMIAHRLSTVEDCDRLYYLENGRLVVKGSFESLKAKSADFRNMVLAGRN